MIIRAKTFQEWFKANFTRGEMKDIAEYGANAGFHHITYYKDTIKLYDKFEDDIWESLCADADSFGYNNPITMIAETFNKNALENIGSGEQFKNLMALHHSQHLPMLLFQMILSSI